MSAQITGRMLKEWGFEAGPHLGAALKAAQKAYAATQDLGAAREAAQAHLPPPALQLKAAGQTPYSEVIEAHTPEEQANLASVRATMEALGRTPTLEALAAMPDACPSGGVGVIPVGGVAAARGAIHPGMHSADICCSVAISILGEADPGEVLDAGHKATHFGGGGRGARNPAAPSAALLERFEGNKFLADIIPTAKDHFATQGDGNHFFYVGTLRSTGETAIVTHHGSRKPGAMLFKRGMQAAEKLRKKRAPEVLKPNAWLEFESHEGEAYWEALQLIRDWTKANHFAIHDLTLQALGAKAKDRFWNEHNFVFRRGDLFYHGKGATPAWRDFAADSAGKVLIPLNMAAPILIAEGTDNPSALGFCPHGAGRNFSRSEHKRRNDGLSAADMMARETAQIEARFYCGEPDVSELPSAYKSAEAIEAQIKKFNLAKIVDHVDPYGSIMAGEWRAEFHRSRKENKKNRDRAREAARRSKGRRR